MRIAVLLGIDKNVALMELNRYQNNTPAHRSSRSVERCDVIDTISLGPQSLAGESMKQETPVKSVTSDFEGSAQEENALLRQEIAHLRKKLEALGKTAGSS